MDSPLLSPPALPSQLHILFENYSANGVMALTDFHKFLIEVQQEIHVSKPQAKNLMEAHLKTTAAPQFLEQEFLQYLFDTRHNLAINTHIHHDMTLPLSHYFIFTGHNSYLTGNQLSSASSEKPIAKALYKRVRVIELDLWPNSQKDDVVVLHGRTLTSSIKFKTCICTIKENAFVNSDFPVIITLEDHLPPKLQDKAAKAIKDTFGAAFFCPEPAQRLKEFPSPESLKGRIVISTKPPKEYLGANDTKAGRKMEQKQSVEKAKIEKQLLSRQHIYDSQPDEKAVGYDEESLYEEGPSSIMQEDRCFPIEYMRIITIHAGKPKGKVSVVAALQVEEYAKRVSLSELQVVKFAASNPSTIAQFTRNNLLRIYPYGLRIDSSNYNPLQAWSYGAQMVAMNMQGYGRHLWVAQGFFRANGGCGYVKKPSFFLPKSSVNIPDIFNSTNPMPMRQKLKVKVCMGYGWLEQYGKRRLPKFYPPNFYTRVGIAGVRSDSVMKKTATVGSNWVPEWEDEFEFVLRVPELAVLRIEVHNEKKRGPNNFVGQTCLPVSELKPGYRVMPLCDKKGDELEFVRILFYFHLSFHKPSLLLGQEAA